MLRAVVRALGHTGGVLTGPAARARIRRATTSIRALSSGPSTSQIIIEQEKEISVLQSDLRAAISGGRWATAAALADECLAATEALFTRDHVAYAAALNNKGLVLKQTGLTKEALDAYDEAFKIYSRLVGQDHASTAATLANLGHCHLAVAEKASGMDKLEHVNTARRCFEDARDARERSLGPNNWQTVFSAVHLASALRAGRQFGEAERVLVAALQSLRSIVGDRHAATATALNNLGFLYRQMKDFDRAGDAYAEAWALRRALFGDAHPDTIATHYNVAELARAKGDEEGAAKLQSQIVALLDVDSDGPQIGQSQKTSSQAQSTMETDSK